MPQTKKQEIVYTVMMVCVMVYGMVCYNICLLYTSDAADEL